MLVQFHRSVKGCIKQGTRYEVIGKEKWSLFYKSHVLIFPTYYENESFGLVNIEAAQFEIPVIATDWRANSELVIDGDTGFIVPTNNPTAIHQKMKYFIDNPLSIDDMGKAARANFLANYTVDSFYQNFNRLFKSIS